MRPRPPEKGEGCAQLLVIIIITITIIINERRKEDITGRKEGLSSAASCGGFSGGDREYISIYRQGREAGEGGADTIDPTSPSPPTSFIKDGLSSL